MNDSPRSPSAAVPNPARTGTRQPGRTGTISAGVLVLVWLASGVFVIRGDEAAVVRIFGRAERNASGSVVLRPNGIHWHLPWPCTTVDRVRPGEVRTVSILENDPDKASATDLLQLADPASQSRFLTGDRNILQVQLNVQYRIAIDRIADWLYSAGQVEPRLRLLAQASLADVVLQSGVDFVHTLGHAEIRKAVLERLRLLSDRGRLGILIEDVTIAGVSPPARVKSHFVDVMNARADRETYINRARAYAEQRLADAGAAARRTLDEASSYRLKTVDRARAEAESFHHLVDQLELTAESLSLSYSDMRRLTVERQRLETLQQLYPRVRTQVFLDEEQPVDLTLHRDPVGD